MNRKSGLTLLLLLAVVLILSLVSCDPGRKYEKEEEAQIQNYLGNNPNQTFQLQPSGLYYYPVQIGTGIMPVVHDTAWVKYTGKFLDGTVFDTNVGKTDSLKVPVAEGWLIPGFDEGITLMNKGGKSMILIPSSLAYGTTGYYIIGPYTPLLFDLELVRVKKGKAQ
jgi:FKBP-type peptidyl-prolyl cis-trans isomerase